MEKGEARWPVNHWVEKGDTEEGRLCSWEAGFFPASLPPPSPWSSGRCRGRGPGGARRRHAVGTDAALEGNWIGHDERLVVEVVPDREAEVDVFHAQAVDCGAQLKRIRQMRHAPVMPPL